MQRIAFQLHIREGCEAEYDLAHQHVFPELLADLRAFGVRDYSIFRRGQQLFLMLHVPDFDELIKRLEGSEANRRWQQKMAPLFEPVPSMQPGEAYAMMHEVFFMSGVDEESPQNNLEAAVEQ